jgi:hypothetical protein
VATVLDLFAESLAPPPHTQNRAELHAP